MPVLPALFLAFNGVDGRRTEELLLALLTLLLLLVLFAVLLLIKERIELVNVMGPLPRLLGDDNVMFLYAAVELGDLLTSVFLMLETWRP